MNKTAIPELKQLMKDENKFFKDKRTQHAEYQKKVITIIGGSEDTEFLLGFLYELYSGQLYGDRCLIRVFIVDSKENLKKMEVAYASVWTSGLPLFYGLLLTSKLEKALPKAEYVIIYPYIKWDNEEPRAKIIKEKFLYMKELCDNITDYCRDDVEVLLIGSRCMIPFRLIIALYLIKLPLGQVHGVSRVVERAAAAMIANKMECDSYEVRGIAVFGEDIVEVESAWTKWGPDCEEDLIDIEKVRSNDPELGEFIDDTEECAEKEELLKLPRGVELIGLHPATSLIEQDIELPPLIAITDRRRKDLTEEGVGEGLEEGESFEREEQDYLKAADSSSRGYGELSDVDQKPFGRNVWQEQKPASSKQSLDSEQVAEKKKFDWREWMKERFPDEEEKKKDKKWSLWADLYLNQCSPEMRFRDCSRMWQCLLAPKTFQMPKEWEKGQLELLHWPRSPPESRYVIANIQDEKFLKGTIFKRCRYGLYGYTMAKGVINYIKKVLMSKRVVYTNEVVCSPGVYGIPEGLYSSFPVRIDRRGNCKIVQGYKQSDMTMLRVRRMVREVMEDYDIVFGMFYNYPPRDVMNLWLKQRGEEQVTEEAVRVDVIGEEGEMEVGSEYKEEK